MDAETWFDCYERLVKAFGRTRDPEQRAVFFEALKGIPGPLLRLGVQKAIQDSKTWPNVAALREFCSEVSRAAVLPATACEVCHGNLWVEAADRAVSELGGLVYGDYVTRCPQCWRGQAA